MLKWSRMMKRKYPKYNFVSNLKVYNIWYLETEVDIADIP